MKIVEMLRMCGDGISNEAADRIEMLEANISLAVEALEPFQKAAPGFNGLNDHAGTFGHWPTYASVPDVGDYRRAARVREELRKAMDG